MTLLREQVVVVTGAGGGIGRETALRLGREGARLALLDRDEEAARATAALIESERGEAAAFACDVTAEKDVAEAATAVQARFGRIDGLVNNAGGPPRKTPLWEMDAAAWGQTLALNLTSAFLVSRAFLPAMIARRTGAIVCLTTDQAFSPTAGRAAYAAAKAGLVGFTRALAVDAGPSGIRVNAVAPGPTLTERTRALAGEAGIAALASRHPLGRLADPSDVADAIAFLLGPGARHITGQVLQINGGLIFG